MSISTDELLSRIVNNMSTELEALSERIRIDKLDGYNTDRLMKVRFIQEQHVEQLKALQSRLAA